MFRQPLQLLSRRAVHPNVRPGAVQPGLRELRRRVPINLRRSLLGHVPRRAELRNHLRRRLRRDLRPRERLFDRVWRRMHLHVQEYGKLRGPRRRRQRRDVRIREQLQCGLPRCLPRPLHFDGQLQRELPRGCVEDRVPRRVGMRARLYVGPSASRFVLGGTSVGLPRPFRTQRRPVPSIHSANLSGNSPCSGSARA